MAAAKRHLRYKHQLEEWSEHKRFRRIAGRGRAIFIVFNERESDKDIKLVR